MKFGLKKEDRKYKDTNPEELNFNIPKEEKIIEEIQEKEFNPWDYIRVVNVRGEPEYQAQPDEKVIIAHRGNPILGNKHPMLKNTMKERERVIAEYQKDLNEDLAINGPISLTLKDIAKDIIENKQKIALACFCSPCDCHAQTLIPAIMDIIEKINLKKVNKIKI